MHYIQKPIEKYGVILVRRYGQDKTMPDEINTNVPHHIVYHSPDGFEWGYAGSGPAELALNLAEIVVRKAKLVTLEGLYATAVAWKIHQNMKRLLIQNVPNGGMTIPWKLVCYAALDACQEENRATLQKHIDKLSR